MEEELKALNEKAIEQVIAKAFSDLVHHECKCRILSRTYSNSGKATFKIEITPESYEKTLEKLANKT
jgi:hypothetical protein